MRGALTVAIVVSSAAVALPANGQWLNHPTPNIPRTSDGKPNLAAPAPRAADGHIICQALGPGDRVSLACPTRR